MAPTAKPENARQRRAQRSRAEILDVATRLFAQRGYAGVTVEEVAAATSTTKRMIYYYFGGKEQLWGAVLARALQALRPEPEPVPSAGTGLDRVRSIACGIYDGHLDHPEVARLLTIENLLPERDVEPNSGLGALGKIGFDALDEALAEGARQGLVRPGVDPWDLLLVIHSFCVFRIANRHTYQRSSGRDLQDDELVARHRRLLDELVTSYLTAR